ncbi:hypothetical protein Btru_031821 [Bulinus truncatus]|nr:hypothetical protein Btru_031821 [Bulinus truncatus]
MASETDSIELTTETTLVEVGDNPLMVNDLTRDVIQFVVLVVLCTAMCLFGLVSNVINIAVFCRQGVKSTVNISFMALSVTDLCNVIFTAWVSICFNGIFVHAPGLAFYPPDVSYLSGGFPHACLSRITAWITVFMTVERYVCIALPFKVKTLFTPRKTAVTIGVISILTMLPLVPEYLFFFIGWTYIPQLNATLLGLAANANRLHLEGISFLVYALMMFTSFPVIILFTAVLIVQLNKVSQWRTSSQGSKGESLATKDKMAVRTVVVIACVLIVTFTPTVLFSILCFVIPGFHLKGRYSNMYIIFVSFAFFFDATNSSVNTILYYVMNSSFRRTLHEMLGKKTKRQEFIVLCGCIFGFSNDVIGLRAQSFDSLS